MIESRQATVRRPLMAVKPPYGSEAERLWMTKNLTERILKDLDSITKYNASQLVDNMNKNKVLKQILIKEKFDVKAEVEEEKDNLIELNEISLSLNEGESNLKDSKSLRMVPGILHFQRKGVQRNDHRDQRQEVLHHLCAARYLSRNIEYDHTVAIRD